MVLTGRGIEVARTFGVYPDRVSSATKLSEKETLVCEVIEKLELLYGRPRRIARFEPMDELISCILSQHSNDTNSFPAFTRLKETYPSWAEVVDAGPEKLADVVRKAGLANQKAKNIIACLTQIHEMTGGYDLEHLRRLPTSDARKWLMELPGVGPKTASIVLCFSMGRETIPVDTHIYRVSRRIGIITSEIDEVKAHDALLAVVPPAMAYRYHVDLIQHGRVVCKAPLPSCSACPLAAICRWAREGGPERRIADPGTAKRRASTKNP